MDNSLRNDEHKIPLEELYQRVESGPEGLTTSAATQRLLQYGPNELSVKKQTPEYIKFLRQFTNFFAVLLIIGGCLAFLAEYLDPGQGNLPIGIALIAVVFLNATFTYLQEHQSERIMESFKKMLPQRITVLRDGREQQIEAKHVVPGDIIILNEGDRIPADGRLIEEHQLKVDHSSLTGESEPELRKLECTHDNILESRNMVFSGTLVQSGNGKALVYGTGMQTQIGRIVKLTKETGEVETPIRRELHHFISVISTIAIILGAIFFLVSIVLGKSMIGSLIFAIGIIVANVPEGLLPTVTLALTIASKHMAKKHALIKNLESVETLGSTTVICTDKTGTITQNKMSVQTVIINSFEFAAHERALRKADGITTLWACMALCNNARLDLNGFIGDPTEGALIVYANKLKPIQGILHNMPRLHETPFDSKTKRMITTNQIVGKLVHRAYMKGAPEVVVDKCSHILTNGRRIPLTAARKREIIEADARLSSRGERVLAFAYKDTKRLKTIEEGFTFIGLVGMLDPPRPGVEESVEQCRTAGIKIIMITGDHGLTAEAIARQVGIIRGEARIILGDELKQMSDGDVSEALDAPDLIFARTSPDQKLRIVQLLQEKGHVVTVTGDGVNDAPALKNADMGVAMGQIGTDVAKEASDMVLLDDDFSTIVAAVKEGRTIFENIKKFIAYILTSNVPEITPFIAYVLLDIPLPLTVVLILAIDLGTDILPALGLGMELPETDVMKKPPRRRDERLLTPSLLGMSYGIIGVLQAAAGFTSFFTVLFTNGWTWGQDLASTDPVYRQAITAFFVSIIICQIADVIICRTRRQSLFSVGLFSNMLVNVGILTEVIICLVIAYVPLANAFFGTAPLLWWHWLISVPFALLTLVGDEFRRFLVRRGNHFVLHWLTW
ncbi:HAD family hydrolase [Candidatus Woesearchaeota archaeon]|nr:MAG: HAD family hydrolase [Candidatus Woesearchaeota archaeon]